MPAGYRGVLALPERRRTGNRRRRRDRGRGEGMTPKPGINAMQAVPRCGARTRRNRPRWRDESGTVPDPRDGAAAGLGKLSASRGARSTKPLAIQGLICDRSHVVPTQEESLSAYAMRSRQRRELRDVHDQQPEQPMMRNPKQEEPVDRRPTEVSEDWFTRIQRAKTAREQGQKAREGRPPVNPIPRMPQSQSHD